MGENFRAYGLQRFIGSYIVPEMRISMCCRVASFGAPSVSMHVSNNQLKLRGVMYCESIWVCPVCSRIIRKERSEKVADLFKRTQENGGVLHFVTLTFTLDETMGGRHNIESMLSAQANAWRSMTKSRAYREWKKQNNINHYMRSLEITHGKKGWHPHYHLVFVTDNTQFDFETLYLLWSAALRLNGGSMSWFAQNYQLVRPSDTKSVSEYVTAWASGLWTISDEVTKEKTQTRRIGSRTPLQIAADAMMGDPDSVELFRQYAIATKGMRTTVFSRGWLQLYGYDETINDDEIKPEMIDGECVISLSPDDYKKLRSYRETFFEAVLDRDLQTVILIARLTGMSTIFQISQTWFGVAESIIWLGD